MTSPLGIIIAETEADGQGEEPPKPCRGIADSGDGTTPFLRRYSRAPCQDYSHFTPTQTTR